MQANKKSATETTGHLRGCGGADLHSRLFLHPLHPWGIFLHKTKKVLHISEKATASHPQKQK